MSSSLNYSWLIVLGYMVLLARNDSWAHLLLEALDGLLFTRQKGSNSSDIYPLLGRRKRLMSFPNTSRWIELKLSRPEFKHGSSIPFSIPLTVRLLNRGFLVGFTVYQLPLFYPEVNLTIMLSNYTRYENVSSQSFQNK